MFKKNLPYLTIFIIVTIVFPGCIEHTFNLTVLSEDEIDVLYEAQGDIMDFSDDGQLLPDSTVWEYDEWVEERKGETVKHVKAKLIITNIADLNTSLDWRYRVSDSLYLDHQFSIIRKTNLLGYTWSFKGTLKSRNFNVLYGDIWDFVPEECRALDNAEKENKLSSDEIKILEDKFALGIIQWNISRYTSLFNRVWQIAITHNPALIDTSETILSIARTGWEEDIHQYLNRLNVKNPSTQNLDWWSDLRPVFLGHMVDLTTPVNADLFSRIGDAVEKEYQITKDIEDDKFTFNLIMPGRKISSNANPEEKECCKWEILGKDLRNEDALMFAKKFEISPVRVAITTFVIILLISFFRRVILRRRSVNGQTEK